MRKNAFFLLLYEIAVYIIPFITAPYVARIIGSYGTGVYSYSYSIVAVFVGLSQLGVSLYGRREIAACITKEERTKAFWSIWYVEAFMGVLCTAIYSMVVLFFFPNNETKVALFLQIMTLVGGFFDISWFYFGAERFVLAVSRNLFIKLLSMILIFTLIKKPSDVILYVVILTLSNLLGVMVMWLSLKKHVEYKKPNIKECQKRFLPLLRMYIPVLSTQLYSLTDKIFLGAIVNVDEVGLYDNAHQLSRVPITLITTIGTVMLPRLTNMLARGEEKKTQVFFEKSLSITFIFGVGFAFGICGCASTFVPLYLGKGFHGAIIYLQLLSLILIPIAWGNAFRTQFILPRKMDNMYLKSVGLAAIINIGCNSILIPIAGGIGAAIGSILAETFICFYQSIKLKEHFELTKLIKMNCIYLFSGVVMLLGIFVISQINIKSSIMLLLIEVTGGIAIYASLILLFERINNNRVVTNEIKRVFKSIKSIVKHTN